MNDQFDAMPWREDDAELHAWQRGVAPVSPSSMRGCGNCGIRASCITACAMIVASFLTKHLLIHWKAGESLVLGHARRCRSGQ